MKRSAVSVCFSVVPFASSRMERGCRSGRPAVHWPPCLLFAVAHAGLRRRWQRGVAISLVVLSIGVHVVGVFGYRGYEAWQRRHELPDQGRSLFELRDTQIEAHARARLNKLSRTESSGR